MKVLKAAQRLEKTDVDDFDDPSRDGCVHAAGRLGFRRVYACRDDRGSARREQVAEIRGHKEKSSRLR